MASRRFRHSVTAPVLFLALIIIFALLTGRWPVLGLTGLGTVAVVSAALVEINRRWIWQDYRRDYQQRQTMQGLWHEPRRLYYDLNVKVLWPLVGLIGLLCLWVALML